MTEKAQDTQLILGRAKYITAKLRSGGWLGQSDELPPVARCLSVLLMAMDWRHNLRYICESLPHHMDVMQLADLRDTMANLGYISEPYETSMGAIDPRLLPCLFVPHHSNHAYVVMPGDTPDQHVYFDGAQGHIASLNDETHHVEGTAYFFRKMDQNKEGYDAQQIDPDTSWFTQLFGRFKSVFWHIILASLMINLVSLSGPLFIMLAYDQVINTHALDTLFFLLFGFTLAILTEFWLRHLRAKSIAWLGTRLDYIVGVAIFERLLFLPPSYTERASVSSQVARIKGFEAVRDFLTSPLFTTFLELPFITITLIAITVIAGPVVFVPIAMIGLYMLLVALLMPRLQSRIKDTAHESSLRQEFVIETLSKLRSLKTGNAMSNWLNRYRDASGTTSHAAFKAGFLSTSIESIAHGISILSSVAVIGFSIGRIWEDQMTVGALVATMILVWRILSPLHTICGSISHLEQVKNSIKQVNRLMHLKPERNPRAIPNPLRFFKGHIEFAHVGLRYTKEVDPVFSNLHFTVEPGELVVIMGANGSGKSTILKLLNGLYHPQVGHINIDGIDIRQMDPIELRQHIAYLPQEVHFFDGSIADNVRLVNPIANDDDLKEALIRADIWEEICELPQGMHSHIGEEDAHHLASGLLNKLNLARIYLSNSSILLLDELPASLIHSEAGDRYYQFLKEQKKHRTMLLIAHEEDYLNIADKVVYLAYGQPPLIGPYKKVLAELNKRKQVHAI